MLQWFYKQSNTARLVKKRKENNMSKDTTVITVQNLNEEDVTVKVDSYGGVEVNGTFIECDTLQIIANFALNMRTDTFFKRGHL